MEKKKFVLRLTVDQYKAIEKWAKDDFRSVNGQIEWMLHAFLKQNKRNNKEVDIESKSDIIAPKKEIN